MKKQAKKLVLAKETVRKLEESRDLKNVAGGTLRDTVCADCVSGFFTCQSAGGGCNTYLC